MYIYIARIRLVFHSLLFEATQIYTFILRRPQVLTINAKFNYLCKAAVFHTEQYSK